MQIRQYKNGDEEQILKLDWQLFPDPWNKRDIPNWKWKHRGNNPAGEALVYVMEHEGKIITHFAVVPYRIRFFGHDILASHSIGSMVAPEWQGKGLIKFVADKLFEDAVIRGITMSWGFPNDLAYELHKKLMGYGDVAQITTLERKTPQGGPVKKRLSEKLLFSAVERFDSSADELWEKAKDIFNISVKRDSAYLNWRFLDRPDQKYFAFGAYESGELKGYVILKLYKDSKILKGHIVDILSVPGRADIASFLVERALVFFAENRTDIESSWLHGADRYSSILKEKGFEEVRPRPLICRLNFDKEKYQKALDGGNWYFTMGDTTEIY